MVTYASLVEGLNEEQQDVRLGEQPILQNRVQRLREIEIRGYEPLEIEKERDNVRTLEDRSKET